MWFQKISIPPPPRKGFAVWPPLPSGFSKIGPQNLPLLPSGISKIFAHPLEILLSLIEVNKEVVLFSRMPNFVSFMYFLLNCMTDKWIPHANSLCTQVTEKFCAFHVISVEFCNSSNEFFCWSVHLRTKTRTSISQKICYVKSGFQILCAVEQFRSLFSKDKLKARGTPTPTHDLPPLRM